MSKDMPRDMGASADADRAAGPADPSPAVSAKGGIPSAGDAAAAAPRHADIPARLRFEARDHRDKMDSFAPVHTGFLLKVADEFEAVLSGLEGLEKAATAVSRQGAQGGFQWVRLTGELLHARALLAKARGQ